ncbi:hypothetical protein [Sphaerisporangium dianthi]|uniref:Aminoglycoside phosphotransferase domain-containing protein n=1 Tax=Sphaerisporangium dianthi TaxID=1436120 RepID=A0ABV9CN10_9ACTN
MRDYRARLGYLDEVTTLLYPATSPSEATSAPTGTASSTTYALLPSRYLPRRLVPRSRWLPGRRRLPQGPGTIETYLSEVFGERVRATVHVRPARRANRKPILEIRGVAGKLLAFVKIGDTDRSRALVRHEGAVLEALAGRPLRVVAAPTVLHHGVWNGLDVLALSPLPTRRRRVRSSLLEDAAHEIAALATPRSAPGEGRRSPFVPSQRASEDHRPPLTPGDAGEHTGPGALGGVHRPVTPGDGAADFSAAGDVLLLPVGAMGGHAWHGDFAPWNMAPAPDGRLAVWDWERFATGVPLGFDALHHFFQRALRRRMPPRLAAEACLASAVRTLAAFGPSAGEARRTAAHYLITLADRYERDGHQPLGAPAEWLNPVLDHQEALQ